MTEEEKMTAETIVDDDFNPENYEDEEFSGDERYVSAPGFEASGPKAWNEDVLTPALLSKLESARVELASRNLKKTGFNKFGNFQYFQLSDFLNEAQKILSSYGLFTRHMMDTEGMKAYLIIYDAKPEPSAWTGEVPRIVFSMPLDDKILSHAGTKQPLQDMGAIITYTRRYLYLSAMEIVEADEMEATSTIADGYHTESAASQQRTASVQHQEGEMSREQVLKAIAAMNMEESRCLAYAGKIDHTAYTSLNEVPTPSLIRTYNAIRKYIAAQKKAESEFADKMGSAD